MDSVVNIEPSASLDFQRPFQQSVRQNVIIKNISSKPLAFKIKTTSPKQYCVRPNHGRVEPFQESEVQVSLQAMSEDPPSDYVCKDKFLIQLCPLDGSESDSNAINAAFEHANKAEIYEKKIRVTYLPSKSSPSPVAITPFSDSVEKERKDGASSIKSFGDSTVPTSIEEKKEPKSESSEVRELESKLKNTQLQLSEYQKKYQALQDQIASLEKVQKEILTTSKNNSSKPFDVNEIISGSLGFPPILVGLIALFAFLVGLLF